VNERKGICRTREDLLEELADVISPSQRPLSSITNGGAAEGGNHFEQRLQTITARTTGR
jgi:hypothetical protein